MLQATQSLLQLAKRMDSLQAFLHVSTAFVNVNQPAGSQVEEVLYSLPPLLTRLGSTAQDVAGQLSSLKPDAATVQVHICLCTRCC